MTSTVINAGNRALDLWIQGLFARMGRVRRFLPQTPCLHGRLGEEAYDGQREAGRRSLSGLYIGMTDLLTGSLCRKAWHPGTAREGESEGRKTASSEEFSCKESAVERRNGGKYERII